MPRLYVQAQKFQIAGSGVSSSATTINLVSFRLTKPDATTRNIVMTDFGDLGLMVLDPGVARKEETISFTGVTQNGDGSAILTGVVRGLTPFSPYGADATYASAHSGFVTAILSNPAKMYANFIGPTDTVAVTGLWTFPYPTTSTSPAIKQYVDDVLAGAIGTASEATAGSTKVTKNQSTKPRAQSTQVREQNIPDMTLKVESFRAAFIDKIINYTGGNSPSFINPGLGGDLSIVTNPSNAETFTLTINGTICVFTFVSVIGATPGNVLIQATAALSRAALAAFIAAPSTTNANQVAFSGAQLTAINLISSTDDLATNLFVRSNSSTVTTFTGAEALAGASNTWTANTTKNRIDLLVLDTTGVIAIRKGTEAVAPTVPTPTTGDTVICSVYNIPGETSIKDVTAALAGYIDQWYDLSVYRTDIATATSVTAIKKFGGSGSDGALALTTGATNINLGGLSYVEKNYTTIDITGTGQLTFSNPHANGTVIKLKSQGNINITSSASPAIQASGMGGTPAGGTPTGTLDTVTHSGATGASSQAGFVNGGIGGLQLSAPGTALYNTITTRIYYKGLYVACGACGGNGGSGQAATSTGGTGGNGGGALIIECGGAWNFTGSIAVSGSNGTNGATSGVGSSAGGGGGGGAGMLLVIYNSLTSSSGTVLAVGGNGGNASNTLNASPTNAGCGGGGASGPISSGGLGGQTGNNPGGNGNAGSNGSGGSGGGGGLNNGSAGGSGAAGGSTSTSSYLIILNTEFA